MTLTKQRKILIAVLSLGLGGLLLDRMVLSSGGTGPSPVAARALPVTGGDTSAAPEAGGSSAAAEALSLAALAAAHRTDEGVAERLSRYAERRGLDPEKVRDGFRPSAKWVAPASPTSAVGAPTIAISPLQQFAQTHQLVAIMGSGAAGVAVINGRTLRVGQSIDGFRLVEVRERTAFLEPTTAAGPGGERVELRLIAGE